MAAPAFAASIAAFAICSGVLGRSGCFFAVSPDPVTAQETKTLLFIFFYGEYTILKEHDFKNRKIIKEWTDYNKHMNVAYYIHVFDIAADVMLDNFKMGGESAKKDKKSTLCC